MASLFSIIIPVYNVEDYIRACVDAVLCQTFKDYEIILVDDGSPDHCPAICDEYAAERQNVKVIHKKNGGLSDARNAGIKEASGEFLIFLDSDDWWENETVLEKIAARLEGCDALYYGRKNVNGDKVWEDPLTQKLQDTYATGIEFMDDALKNKATFPWFACLYAFQRDLIKANNIEFPVGRVYEDTATTYKVLLLAKKVAVFKENCYCYRHNRENRITGRATLKSMKDRIAASKTGIEDILQREGIPEDFRRRMLNNFGAGYIEVLNRSAEVAAQDRHELFRYLKEEQSMLQYVRSGKHGLAAQAIRIIGIHAGAYLAEYRKQILRKLTIQIAL